MRSALRDRAPNGGDRTRRRSAQMRCVAPGLEALMIAVELEPVWYVHPAANDDGINCATNSRRSCARVQAPAPILVTGLMVVFFNGCPVRPSREASHRL